jgi:hypothetical protein
MKIVINTRVITQLAVSSPGAREKTNKFVWGVVNYKLYCQVDEPLEHRLSIRPCVKKGLQRL